MCGLYVVAPVVIELSYITLQRITDIRVAYIRVTLVSSKPHIRLPLYCSAEVWNDP